MTYVALDGPDGCGKSTQAERLTTWLRDRGANVLHVREPGSTAFSEGLRRVLLDPATGELTPFVEALLFTAARAELVRTVIAPALRQGTWVVAERCYLSTWVYQGVASESDAVPMPLLRELTDRAHGAVWPDRIVVLDVPADVAHARTGGRRRDRIEGRSRAFHERVRSGYAALAAADPRCAVVDASGPPDAVHEAVLAALADLLEVRR